MGHEKEINLGEFLQWIEGHREDKRGKVTDVREDFEWDYLNRVGFANSINVIGGMAAVATLKGFQYD